MDEPRRSTHFSRTPLPHLAHSHPIGRWWTQVDVWFLIVVLATLAFYAMLWVVGDVR